MRVTSPVRVPNHLKKAMIRVTLYKNKNFKFVNYEFQGGKKVNTYIKAIKNSLSHRQRFGIVY